MDGFFINDHPSQSEAGAQFNAAVHLPGKVNKGCPGNVPVGRTAVDTDGSNWLTVKTFHIKTEAFRGTERNAKR